MKKEDYQKRHGTVPSDWIFEVTYTICGKDSAKKLSIIRGNMCPRGTEIRISSHLERLPDNISFMVTVYKATFTFDGIKQFLRMGKFTSSSTTTDNRSVTFSNNWNDTNRALFANQSGSSAVICAHLKSDSLDRIRKGLCYPGINTHNEELDFLGRVNAHILPIFSKILLWLKNYLYDSNGIDKSVLCSDLRQGSLDFK